MIKFYNSIISLKDLELLINFTKCLMMIVFFYFLKILLNMEIEASR